MLTDKPHYTAEDYLLFEQLSLHCWLLPFLPVIASGSLVYFRSGLGRQSAVDRGNCTPHVEAR